MVQEAFQPLRVQACMRLFQDIVILRHLAEPVSVDCKISPVAKVVMLLLKLAADVEILMGQFRSFTSIVLQ